MSQTHLKRFPELEDVVVKCMQPNYQPPMPEMKVVRNFAASGENMRPYLRWYIMAELLSMLREACTETDELPVTPGPGPEGK